MKLIVSFATILFGLNVSAQKVVAPRNSTPQTVKIIPKTPAKEAFDLNRKEDELNSNSKITSQIKIIASEMYVLKYSLKYNKIEESQISNAKIDLKEKQKIFCSLVEQIGFENTDLEIREVYVESIKYVNPDKLEKILSN